MRRLAPLPALIVAVFAIAACSSSGSSPAASAPAASAGGSAGGGGGGGACAKADAGATAAVTVEIKDFKFAPDPVEAAVGDAVGWTNGDSAPHTATLDDGSCDTGNINQGATGVLVFNEAGTYTYHCSIHTNMKGTINVT
ncbi:MAG TPA: cupredoxin family copper-binding protein [Candidatus Limnocylindrales bacterium]|nr:cupredoxin family copper-binding protein [Candidatus Limnocylindrales bacterium]